MSLTLRPLPLSTRQEVCVVQFLHIPQALRRLLALGYAGEFAEVFETLNPRRDYDQYLGLTSPLSSGCFSPYQQLYPLKQLALSSS